MCSEMYDATPLKNKLCDTNVSIEQGSSRRVREESISRRLFRNSSRASATAIVTWTFPGRTIPDHKKMPENTIYSIFNNEYFQGIGWESGVECSHFVLESRASFQVRHGLTRLSVYHNRGSTRPRMTLVSLYLRNSMRRGEKTKTKTSCGNSQIDIPNDCLVIVLHDAHWKCAGYSTTTTRVQQFKQSVQQDTMSYEFQSTLSPYIRGQVCGQSSQLLDP
jgi:hypothetical protein